MSQPTTIQIRQPSPVSTVRALDQRRQAARPIERAIGWLGVLGTLVIIAMQIAQQVAS